MKYSNLPPWPSATANGNYLALTDPMSDNSKAENWKAENTKIVSVEDPENINQVRLYPSPVKDFLNLEVAGEKYILQIYDFQGRLLKADKYRF